MAELIFLGAGISSAFDVPTMSGFYPVLREKLKESFGDLLEEIISVLETNNRRVDLESIYTVVNDFEIASSPDQINPAVLYRYSEQLQNELGKVSPKGARMKNLREGIDRLIIQYCTPKKESYSKIFDVFSALIQKYAESMQKQSIEILTSNQVHFFTTNYDTCLEAFFEIARYRLRNDAIQLNTGTIGATRYWSPYRFRDKASIPWLVKLHGSIDLYETDVTWIKGEVKYEEHEVRKLMIFPTRGKYLYDQPWFELQKLFRDELYGSARVIFFGSSFEDQSLRDALVSVINRLKAEREWGYHQRYLKVIVCGRDPKSIIQSRLSSIADLVIPVEVDFNKQLPEDLAEKLK